MRMQDPTYFDSNTVQGLRAENAFLQQELNACKIKLLRLQQSDDQISDTSIQQQGEHLRISLDRWVDDALYEETKDFRETYSRHFKSELTTGYLEDLGLCDGKQLAKSASNWWGINWLGMQPCCNCVVVSLVIWRFLEQQIFRRSVPIGTSSHDPRYPDRTQDEIQFLEGIYEAIATQNVEDAGDTPPCEIGSVTMQTLTRF